MTHQWIIAEYDELLRDCSEEDLVTEITELYHSIVHSIDPSIYSPEEQQAWSPGAPDIHPWIERFRKAPPLLALTFSGELKPSNVSIPTNELVGPKTIKTGPADDALADENDRSLERNDRNQKDWPCPALDDHRGGRIIGFMNLEFPATEYEAGTAHLDLAYVATKYQGSGVAGALYERLESEARHRGALKITVDASHLARPFFMKRGYRFLTENQVPRNGLYITNFSLEKVL